MSNDVIPFPIDPDKRRRDELVAGLRTINRLREDGTGGCAGTGLPIPSAQSRPASPAPVVAVPLSQRVRGMLLDGRPTAEIVAEIEAWERKSSAATLQHRPDRENPATEAGEPLVDPAEMLRAEAAADAARRKAALDVSLKVIREIHGSTGASPSPPLGS